MSYVKTRPLRRPHSLTDPELPGFYLENVARLLAADFKDASEIIDPGASKSADIIEFHHLMSAPLSMKWN
jgi:hypothetical protein